MKAFFGVFGGCLGAVLALAFVVCAVLGLITYLASVGRDGP